MFRTAISLVSTSTVLPSFIALLAGSEVIVGLVQGAIDGAWFLPQLLTAGAVARLERKKPLIVRVVAFGRSLLFLLALSVGLWADRKPRLVLLITVAVFFTFFIADGIASVPWFDMLAKALPARRRGRVLGAGQIIGGIGGIGAGMLVRYVLSDVSPWRYPVNYAVLFGIGAIVFSLGLIPLLVLKEPPGVQGGDAPPTMRQLMRLLPRILRDDRAFALLVGVRVLTAFGSVATAFYVLHGQRNLGFGPDDIGLFVSAQVFGSLVAGFVTSVVQDRWGPVVHMKAVIASSALPPILALATFALQAGLGPNLLYLYMGLYFALGIYIGSFGWPYLNWVFEHTSEAQRPLYIGLLNTLSAIVMLAPALGGWIVSVASYQAVFGLALAFAMLALLLLRKLPSPRGPTP